MLPGGNGLGRKGCHPHWVKICYDHNGQINLRAKQKYEVVSARKVSSNCLYTLTYHWLILNIKRIMLIDSPLFYSFSDTWYLCYFKCHPTDFMKWPIPCGAETNVLESEFELQSRYYVHFWTNTLEKDINFIISLSYGLNNTTKRMPLASNNRTKTNFMMLSLLLAFILSRLHHQSQQSVNAHCTSCISGAAAKSCQIGQFLLLPIFPRCTWHWLILTVGQPVLVYFMPSG